MEVAGLEYTYNSCDLIGFGYDGNTCGLGFRPKGSCGPTYYNATCPSGSCCSASGFCGVGPAYCNENSIQPPTSSTGRCGLGPFQPKCALGHCCSGVSAAASFATSPCEAHPYAAAERLLWNRAAVLQCALPQPHHRLRRARLLGNPPQRPRHGWILAEQLPDV